VVNKLKVNISERDSLINDLNVKLKPANEIDLIFRGTIPSGTEEGVHLGFIVHATNVSGRTLNDCRFETSVPMDGDFADVPNWCVSSPPFSLHPGGSRNCEILSGSLTEPAARLSIVEFSQTDGKWTAENPLVTRLVLPGLYTVFVRVIAEDMAPATMKLRLTHEGRWDAQDVSKR
jgi:hypothetical protein